MTNPRDPGASRFEGRVALVTGAASGIGWATSLLFADHAAVVVLTDVDEEGLKGRLATLEGRGATCASHALDVTDESAWRRVVSGVVETHSKLDVLVNCAGITDDAPLTELTLARWRKVMAVNLDGVFLGTAAAIRAMIPAKEGSIVNVSSLSGVRASPGAAAYCTSKAGVIHLTRVAALECAQAGHRIRVNAVVPGGVKTPMWETTGLWPQISETPEWTASREAPALQRFAEPEEIAWAILFLASPESSYVSGAALHVDGGASAG